MRNYFFATIAGLLLLSLSTATSPAHVGPHPSVHDTVAGVIERMKRDLSTNELSKLTPQTVEQFLTDKEREIMANEHISFRVSVPVRVSILRDVKLGDEPFWLRQRGFTQTGITLKEGRSVFDVWQKDFPAGAVGLGIHSFTGSGNHYLVLLSPQKPGDKVEVTQL